MSRFNEFYKTPVSQYLKLLAYFRLNIVVARMPYLKLLTESVYFIQCKIIVLHLINAV